MPPYVNNPDKITYFAETDYRSKRIKFGIRDDDRARHMYIIGKTGMGKSTLLENLAIQDIQNGEGVCFIDPHGGTAETLLSYVPEHRIKDVIYFAPFDQEYPVGLNVIEDMGRDKRPLVVSGLMGSFKKVWVDAWSARMEYILNNTMLALMETPGTTLLGVNRMYADKDYRAMIVANVTDPSVRAFWLDEYAKYSEKFATEATAAIQNKVGQFAANPLIRNLVGQPKSTFDIRDIMDTRKIFIVNLSKGRMGEGNASLVGSMLITKIYLAAMSRADVGPETVKNLPPFYLYVDEFQSFANESFADILSEARKYKLSLTIAHQYIEQMSDEVRAAVFGNVGTMVSFRVGSYDADVLEKEFAPVFLAEDMVNLGFAQVYMKLMIRGIGSPPFSATTLNRPAFPARNFANEVIEASHTQFALPRAQVEEDIRKWHEPVPPQPRDPNAPPETKKYAPGMRPPSATAPRPASFTPSGPQQIFTPSFSPSGAPLATPAIPKAPYAPAVPMAPRVQPVDDSREVAYVPPDSIPAPAPTAPVTEYTTPRVFTPTPQVAPPVTPAPQRTFTPSAVHQPFKQSLATLKSEKGETSRGNDLGAPQVQPKFVHTERLKQRNEDALSLNVLKSEPKKNKGPTEANLSSLKDALSAVMAKPIEKKDQKAEVQKPPAPSTQFVERRQTEKSRESHGALGVVAQVDAGVVAPENFKSPIMNTSSIQSVAEKPVPSTALLGDMNPAPAPKEVPEDILRSVLAD